MGPRGEDGVREDLHRKLGRDPDPNEVHFEMQRKKGYSGVSKKRRQILSREKSPVSEDEVEVGDRKKENTIERVPASRSTLEEKGRTVKLEVRFLEKMEKELNELRAQMRAVKKASVPEAVDDGGPSSSVRIGGSENNANADLVTDVTVKLALRVSGSFGFLC